MMYWPGWMGAAHYTWQIRRSGSEIRVPPHVGAVSGRPPSGAGLTTTVVRRHILLHLQHHDRASLLAGKLHAVLQRAYLKGRDLYDLLLYILPRAARR
ncbi:MAG: hypothetical protein JW892_09260 [Anaerolineae bacterium]|nr:hypothetical protein [Anaerolineae bacterium]